MISVEVITGKGEEGRKENSGGGVLKYNIQRNFVNAQPAQK
jgi:hypothetical protein